MVGKKTKHRTVIILAVALLCIVVLASGAFILVGRLKSQTVISKQILDQANFTIFYPPDKTGTISAWKLQKDRTGYDKESGVLTLYISQASTGRVVTLNEQPTPGVFADVPTQYGRMLDTLNEYNELQLGFGTVALTHPKELNGGQTAVANKAGTLIFAKPSSSLTDTEWGNFFQNLHILR
jgi:hypothetical protein